MAQPQDPSSTAHQNGIDIRDALSILSSRAKTGGDADLLSNDTVPDKLKQMGQTIDIVDQMEFANKPNNLMGCDCARNPNDAASTDETTAQQVMSEEEKEKHEAMKQERERRGEEIRTKLSTMSVVDLLGMIFGAQQERVATYKLFEEGLSTILASGNITTYPALCAKVTASFSVLSDTINAVKGSLEKKHNRKDITKVIANLQKAEGEKLNLTAALHLEQLRLSNSKLEGMISKSSSEEGGDDRTMRLLNDGIQTLKHKISGVVERINEELEELRCIAADEE